MKKEMNIKHVHINGASGTGKSTYAKEKILKKADEKGKKVLIIDPEDEYEYKQIKNIKKLKEYFEKQNIVRYVPDITKEKEELLKEVDNIYKFIFNYCRNLVILVDEAPSAGADLHKPAPHLRALLTRGRKRGLQTILISQRISQIHKDISGNCRIKVFFKCAEEIDWDRYRQINREAYEYLKNNPNPHAYVVIVDGTITKKG
jgi:DNA helicase HerA-like ATPase